MARRLPLVLAVLAAATLVAGASEVIKFKNGHTMVVESSRVDGTTLFVTLQDGAVLGFPVDLITVAPERSTRLVGGGKANRKRGAVGSGRGPRGEDLIGYRREKNMIGEGRLSSENATARHSQQVGYLRPKGGKLPGQEVRNKKGGFRVTDVIDFNGAGRVNQPTGPGAPLTGQGDAPTAKLPQSSMRPAKSFTASGKPVDDR